MNRREHRTVLGIALALASTASGCAGLSAMSKPPEARTNIDDDDVRMGFASFLDLISGGKINPQSYPGAYPQN